MNYLKYWRVVRYFIQAKYGITQPDLEMMLFLYDEPYFLLVGQRPLRAPPPKWMGGESIGGVEVETRGL
jgi:hypothetical protein